MSILTNEQLWSKISVITLALKNTTNHFFYSVPTENYLSYSLPPIYPLSMVLFEEMEG